MTREVPLATSGAQMSILRASPQVLLLATAMAIISLCQLMRQADAGGKGKGNRQGHIIVQNEVKGNPVPIYMPIPIPIPMPMGPPPGKPGHPQQHHHHHHNQQQRDEHAEGEVKKIYLLQPVARPQPHLKGGGFMGVPVQNNIHVGMSPGKFRHGGGGGRKSFFEEQQQLMNQQAPIQQQLEEHKHMKSASSEVKILPIVVIPPIAPMPPVQVPNSQSISHAPRMTLTPHFNNYVLAAGTGGSQDRRRSVGVSGHQQHHQRGAAKQESFADYGGSLGASVFRERFAARSRPGRGRAFRSLSGAESVDLPGVSNQRHWRAGPQSSSAGRDFDYGDYEGQAPLEQSRALEFESQWPSSSSSYRRRSAGLRRAQLGEQHRVKSIRDIIEQGNGRHPLADIDELGPSGAEEYPADPARGGYHGTTGRGYSSPIGGPDLQVDSLGEFASHSRGPSMEISLEELGLLDKEQRQAGGPELSSLYYDRGLDQADQHLSASSGRAARLRSSANQFRYSTRPGDERDIFDENNDEWRFETLKSVRHVAANETEPTSTGGATPGATMKEPLGASRSKDAAKATETR